VWAGVALQEAVLWGVAIVVGVWEGIEGTEEISGLGFHRAWLKVFSELVLKFFEMLLARNSSFWEEY